jgi:hypothetical protein
VGNPFGLRGGVPPADEGAGTEYCNARADECSPGHITCGERAVYFRGTEYRVIGFYFMSAPTGGCDLCYILRAASHDYRTPFSAKPVLADFAGSVDGASGRRGRSSVPGPGENKAVWRQRRLVPDSSPDGVR